MRIKNVFIIAKREIKTRIENKWFLISLVLFPLFLIGIYMFPVISFIITKPEKIEIEVWDKGRKILPYLKNTPLEFSIIEVSNEKDFELIKSSIKDTNKKVIILKIPEDLSKTQVNVVIYTNKSIPSKVKSQIINSLERALFYYKLEALGIPRYKYEAAKVKLSTEYVKISEDGEQKFSEEVGEIVGFASAMLMYILLMGYGSMMANSTMGEKRNKVVEMVLVVVKPVELLFGKIIGLAILSILQYSAWVIMTILFGLGAMLLLPKPSVDIPTGEVDTEKVQNTIEILQNLPVSWDFVALLLIFFVLGYLVYASLFAAFASIGDPDTDSGRYLLIAMLPIILAIATLGIVLSNPASGISVTLSLIPLTSPIIMPVRIAAEAVSYWEIILSIGLLLLSAYIFTFVGAKIYKMNILSSSGKLTLNNLLYWLRS